MWNGSPMPSKTTCRRSSFWSYSTAWRWLNVPRSESCPISRTWWPACSSDAIASASPVAQSNRLPFSMLRARSRSRRCTFGCASKPSGMRVKRAPSSCSSSIDSPVGASSSCARSTSTDGTPRPVPSVSSPSGAASAASSAEACQLPDIQSSAAGSYDSAAASSSCSVSSTSARIASTSSIVVTPSSISRSVYICTTVLCSAMRLYMIGCVNIGSSCSLWPCRRYPTRSNTHPRPNSCRNSAAVAAAKATASGSSADTCSTGSCIACAASVGCGLERDRCGLVVKPIWLFNSTWIMPPTE
mmetsp:Transcript_11264/g.39233  ORF Transcript_11264/g.39233 Transcript_11264/m.39233 type:complete len:300 (+) Transcript_11264:1333-2232(+)